MKKKLIKTLMCFMLCLTLCFCSLGLTGCIGENGELDFSQDQIDQITQELKDTKQTIENLKNRLNSQNDLSREDAYALLQYSIIELNTSSLVGIKYNHNEYYNDTNSSKNYYKYHFTNNAKEYVAVYEKAKDNKTYLHLETDNHQHYKYDIAENTLTPVNSFPTLNFVGSDILKSTDNEFSWILNYNTLASAEDIGRVEKTATGSYKIRFNALWESDMYNTSAYYEISNEGKLLGLYLDMIDCGELAFTESVVFEYGAPSLDENTAKGYFDKAMALLDAQA